MARGTADDLTLPSTDSEELAGLARRLNVSSTDLIQLTEQHAANVRAWTWSLGWPISPV